VWSPHIAYDDFNDYYPGDDVVDWVGATVLNYGNVAFWSEWWTFDDIFTRKYDRLAAHQKPIMLAEMGTLMAGGERAPWFEQALTRLPKRLPRVKAVVFFHDRTDATITYQALNWSFDDDPEVIKAVRRSFETWKTSDSERTASLESQS
jgi:beta-mannanase